MKSIQNEKMECSYLQCNPVIHLPIGKYIQKIAKCSDNTYDKMGEKESIWDLFLLNTYWHISKHLNNLAK